MVTKMREKGQITIPASISGNHCIYQELRIVVTRIGDRILQPPRPSVFETVSRKILKYAKTKGITLDNLLKDLKKIRHQDH